MTAPRPPIPEGPKPDDTSFLDVVRKALGRSSPDRTAPSTSSPSTSARSSSSTSSSPTPAGSRPPKPTPGRDAVRRMVGRAGAKLGAAAKSGKLKQYIGFAVVAFIWWAPNQLKPWTDDGAPTTETTVEAETPTSSFAIPVDDYVAALRAAGVVDGDLDSRGTSTLASVGVGPVILTVVGEDLVQEVALAGTLTPSELYIFLEPLLEPLDTTASQPGPDERAVVTAQLEVFVRTNDTRLEAAGFTVVRSLTVNDGTFARVSLLPPSR